VERAANVERLVTRFERIGASPIADGTDASIEARVTNQYQSPYVVLP